MKNESRKILLLRFCAATILTTCGLTATWYLKIKGSGLIESKVSRTEAIQVKADFLFLDGLKDFESALEVFFETEMFDENKKKSILEYLKNSENKITQSSEISKKSSTHKKVLAHVSAIKESVSTGKKSNSNTLEHLNEHWETRQVKPLVEYYQKQIKQSVEN